jgi:hypothetical protein
MPENSFKPRRVRVATGVYVQDGAYFANYREPRTGRQRMQRLDATTLRQAKRERESILADLRHGRRAPRSTITLAALADE